MQMTVSSRAEAYPIVQLGKPAQTFVKDTTYALSLLVLLMAQVLIGAQSNNKGQELFVKQLSIGPCQQMVGRTWCRPPSMQSCQSN